jgi:hypothetical protein
MISAFASTAGWSGESAAALASQQGISMLDRLVLPAA